MTKIIRILVSLFFISLTAVSSIASATNYTLWVNGRGGGGVVGDYTSFSYWGPNGANCFGSAPTSTSAVAPSPFAPWHEAHWAA